MPTDDIRHGTSAGGLASLSPPYVNAGSTGVCRSSRLVKEEMEKHDAALAAIDAKAAQV